MMLAGTSRGVFDLSDGDSGADRVVLEAKGVRELVAIDGRLFAGTSAGVYVSDDKGETWSGPQLADAEIWVIRSAGNGVVYLGTSPSRLYRSDDLGTTWREVESFAKVPEAAQWCVPLDPPLPARARALVVDQADPNRVWVGVEVGGVARTADGGETWIVDLPGRNPDLHMMCADPADRDVLFISTGYGRFDHIAQAAEGNAGVFRSDDAGATWNYAWRGVTPRYSRPMCIDERAPYSLTVASAPTAFSNYREDGGAQAALMRSDDRGESWRSLCDEAHQPSAANFHGLTVDPQHVGGVIIGTDTGEVWRVSKDAQWSAVATGLPTVLALLAT